jgi:hypothetical protein
VSLLTRPAWSGFSARPLSPSGFCTGRMPLRPCRRLQPSIFVHGPSILIAPQELGYDGSLGSLARIFREHAGSPFHRMTAASRAQYGCILGVISRNHGGYLVRSLTWLDVLNWHGLWTAPIGIDPERLAGGRQAFFVLKAQHPVFGRRAIEEAFERPVHAAQGAIERRAAQIR